MTTVKIILAVKLLFLFTFAVAQNKVTDTSATIVGYWQKGDKAKLSFTQTKERYKNGQLGSRGSSTCMIDFLVADATENSYTIHWKYGNIKLSETSPNPQVDKLSKLTEGITLVYQTDEMGTFKELLNWKEVQKIVYDAVDSVGRQVNKGEMNAILSQLKNVYASKESIEQIVIRDVQLFHSLYGGDYVLKQKLVADTELPNFLGGEPFPAILTIEMTELKPRDKYCKVQILQTINKEKATKLISDFVEKLSAGKSKETVIPAIGISDFNEFEVELNKGWVLRAFYKRIAEAENIKNIETYEIKKL